jgi:DNA-binding Lrp family transcriptional regulator
LEDLKGTKGVVGSWIVYGVYDIVAKIEADTMDELKEIITTNIRGLENVRSTLTMIVVEGANE